MKKRLILSVIITSLVLSTMGCGSSKDFESSETNAFYTEDVAAEGWADTAAADTGYAEEKSVEAPTEAGREDLEGYDLSRKIVYTSNIGIESKKFDEDVVTVKGLITSNGGYIQSSSQYGSAEYGNRDCHFTARIPAKSYDAFMSAVGSVGSMTSKYEDVQDITSEYVDVQARLKSLNTKMERLRELEAKAETVEELLQIEDRINDVQYQIESYTAQKRVYDDQVDYSTVDITIEEVATFTEVKADTAWNRFVDAAKDSCSGFITFLQDFVIALIYLFPYALIIVVIIFIIAFIRRKKGKGPLFKYKKKKKEQEVTNTEK